LTHLFSALLLPRNPWRTAPAAPTKLSGECRSVDCIVCGARHKPSNTRLNGHFCPMRNYPHCGRNRKKIIFADRRSGVLRGWNVRLRMRAVCVTFDKADCRPSCNSTPLNNVR
jgi:hypothetical protein